MMLVKEKNTNNAFIDLLNFKIKETKEALYKERFGGICNEPHRLKYLLSVRGIGFIDDAKAQSVNAIWYSLESIGAEVTLVVRDIQNMRDFLKIKQLLMLKVKGIVFLTNKNRYVKLLRPFVGNVYFAQTMDEAVRWAYEHTEKDDAVLFCGGVAINVEQESAAFREAVRKL